MAALLYKEEVYEIIGCCMEVWNTLGYGFSEVIYKDAPEIEFEEREIPYLREDEMLVYYKGRILKHKFRSDFSFENAIVLEVKSGEDGIIEKSIQQTINYLKASRCRVGLIVNFGRTRLGFKRLVL